MTPLSSTSIVGHLGCSRLSPPDLLFQKGSDTQKTRLLPELGTLILAITCCVMPKLCFVLFLLRQSLTVCVALAAWNPVM